MTTVLQPVYLFDAGPQKDTLNLTSPEVLEMLQEFCRAITDKIGAGKSIMLYPHRVVQHYWGLELEGDKDKLPILINITGRFRLPQFNANQWPARLIIDMADHIDAYWFAMFLAEKLHLVVNSPSVLSTSCGDNTVCNVEEKANEPS
ncbi:TPA: hypothetical protein RNX34_002155 [Pasteurella multocida]|uniref:Uncharacterized protein n=1 Tax=Actinobacillus equuli subsp. equuli TaxID=202947 RepID=A0A9X4JCQ7_ACTEU|nr:MULTISPECIES: hypothetical protein [Pasteurellaceae]MDE8035231.1 hypothetical protein [Actinobacillus equuli subsp. equuli]QCA32159.1 hypothetical protein E5U06_09660 [Pasteurella multocida]QXG51769.1 hypothetical protein KSF84_01490 [Pasteurella multocida]WGE13654.1 hypothetical protein PM3_0282 [Pasteurella multocida]HDX0990421.1 hypothetical protein [Pasteurella multocida]